jgi:hypothetical protein
MTMKEEKKEIRAFLMGRVNWVEYGYVFCGKTSSLRHSKSNLLSIINIASDDVW